MYSAYCSKNGYNEVQDLEINGRRTLRTFNIKIESQEGKVEPAYINIRFKTKKERAQVQFDNEKLADANSIKKFLSTQCIYS